MQLAVCRAARSPWAGAARARHARPGAGRTREETAQVAAHSSRPTAAASWTTSRLLRQMRLLSRQPELRPPPSASCAPAAPCAPASAAPFAAAAHSRKTRASRACSGPSAGRAAAVPCIPHPAG
eukprot:2899023-Prymnesium_polylepis.1